MPLIPKLFSLLLLIDQCINLSGYNNRTVIRRKKYTNWLNEPRKTTLSILEYSAK